MAATYLLPNAVGEANARELLLTGRTVDADEARASSDWSPVSSRPTRSTRRSARSRRGSPSTAPIPSRYTKVALRDGGHRDLESCVQWEALAQPITLATADLQEGIRAAREKRPAASSAASEDDQRRRRPGSWLLR